MDKLVEPAGELLLELEELYLRGRYLDAYECAAPLGPLAQWRGVGPRILAAKLARVLGNSRLSDILLYLAWREHRDSPRAFAYYSRNHFSRNGLLKTLSLLERYPQFVEGDNIAAEMQSYRAFLYGFYRDFTRADALMAEALAAAPDDPWIRVEHAHLLEMEDDYDAALAAVDQALAIVPNYRAAVQGKAHLLQLCGKEEEALALLQQASTALQSEGVVAQLLAHHQEQEDLPQIAASLAQIESLTPLKSKDYEKWLAANRCNYHYLCGEIEEAITQAELNGSPYFKKLAEELGRSGGKGERKRLRVEFVRQRHMTCGPATLSALSNYFGKPVAQQAIIDSIWYGGTRDYDERKWAIENGWHVLEFSLDWVSARALIDAGIPCALATQEADSAHLQALTGYDEQMGALFIRDPFSQYEQEFLQQPFFEKYSPFGPRAMVMVPAERAATLHSLKLPEHKLWDALFTIRDSLKQHQRDAAGDEFVRVFGASPQSDLACQARRELGWYDNNMEEVAAVDRLQFERYPDNDRIKLNQLYSLNRIGHREAYQGLLQQEGEKEQAHLSLVSLYAEALSDDGRQQQRAESLLGDVVKRAPKLASAYQSYGYLLWQQRRYAEAEKLYRIAASLDEADEGFALDYYRLARLNRHGDEVVAWLQQRFERNASKSPYPAITLYRAYELQNRQHQGLALLERAVAARPDDGELLLFASNAQLDNGNSEQAQQLLAQAEPLVSPGQWLFTSARHAAQQRRHQRALQQFNALVQSEPLNYRAHEELVWLHRELNGEARAIAHMRELCRRFPDNLRLHEQLIELLEQEQPAEAELELKRLLQRHPANAYAQRQLADLLIQADRYDEAWQALQTARALDADAPGLHNICGDLYARRGEREQAMVSYRETLRVSADNEYAIHALMGLCHSSAEKQEQLAYLLQQLMAQTTSGAGLLSYQLEAHNILPAEPLLETLREAHQLRPDLWQSWSTLIGELRDNTQLEEARALAEEAVQRFPLLPRTHLDLAHVYKRQNDIAGQRETLQQALRINPHWDRALMELADNYERSGDYPQELKMLQDAAIANPSSAQVQGYLADALWRRGEQESALIAIRNALELSPGYDWAWGRLRGWSEHMGEEWLLEQTARAVVERKPGLPQSWYYLAESLWPLDEKLEALNQAISRNPNYLPAYEQKAELLVQHQRFSEARQVIADYDRGDGIPVALRSYGPWMDYQRGEVDRAIIDLKAMMEGEPAYYSGWSMLASWCEDNERPGDALIACQRMVALRPDDGDAQVRLADALLLNNKPEEAKQTLQQALLVLPQHESAGIKLFDLQLEDDELEDAQATLHHLYLHLAPELEPYVVTRELKLAGKRGEQARALELFYRLTRSSKENTWFFNTAYEAFSLAGWEQELERASDDLVKDLNGVNPAFASVWAERQHEASETEWKLSNRSIGRLLNMGKAGHRVVEDYLSYIHRIGSIWRLDRLIKRYRKPLREDIDSLINVAYIYAAQGRYRDNVAWMRGWREMKGLPAWALNNYAISLREMGLWDQHYEVLQQIMPQLTEALATPVRLWLSLELWLRGETQTLNDQFALIEEEGLTGDDYYAYQLLLALIEFDSTAELPPQQRFGRVIIILREGHRGFHGLINNMMLWRIQHRVLWQLAQRMAEMPGALYYWWRMMNWTKFFL